LGELVVVVVIEEIMQFGHEQLDVYRVSREKEMETPWVTVANKRMSLIHASILIRSSVMPRNGGG